MQASSLSIMQGPWHDPSGFAYIALGIKTWKRKTNEELVQNLADQVLRVETEHENGTYRQGLAHDVRTHIDPQHHNSEAIAPCESRSTSCSGRCPTGSPENKCT